MPGVTPVTTPATTVEWLLLLVHDPPPSTSLSVVVRPVQTLVVPAIAVGNGLTVSVVVDKQPLPNE